MFPPIKNHGTIDRKLDVKMTNGKKEYLRTLLPDEEKGTVRYIKNKNRAHQVLSKKQVLELILDVLKMRQHMNKKSKGGRKHAKLSASANYALRNGKLLSCILSITNCSYMHGNH